MKSQNYLFDIINEQDIVVGQATEQEIREKNLLHHSVHLLIVDAHHRLFCAHRLNSFENEWSMLYLLKSDAPPFLHPEKFQEGKFLSSSEIRTLSQKEKVTPYLLAALKFSSLGIFPRKGLMFYIF